jgi:hypothetical protein
MDNQVNHAALIPFYCMLAAFAIFFAVIIAMTGGLIRSNKRREKRHAKKYPQAIPMSKVIPFKTHKN